MPKYKVTTDRGTFAVELDQEPESQEQLNSLVTAHLSGQGPTETASPANAREELRAKAFAKTPAQLQKEIRQQQVGEENAANESWLPGIGTLGAGIVRTAGGVIPGGPIASEPLAQLYENVAGTRQGFSPGMMAAETGLSMIPGGTVAKGVGKLFPSIGKTGARVAEHALMGEAATALPAAIEGQPYTPGLGAAGGAVLGRVGEKIIPRLQQKAGQVAARPHKLVYGALSEGIGHRTARAQRLESEINKGLEPVFDFAAQANRQINTVDDLKTVAKDMARLTDVEFNNAVESVGDRMVSGKPIADEIRAEITDLVRRQNPAQAEGLERLAASFDRDMPIREVNQLRREVTGKLDNFYSKSPLQREHPPLGIEAESSMADGLRNVLYDNLEQIFPDDAVRQRMRERGAAEGISKYASESAGAARRGEMAATEARGLLTTPLTKGEKLAKAAISPRETLGKGIKYLQRPDKKISEAYKLYIPKKSTIAAPIGKPGPHGLPPQGPTPDDLLQNAGGQIRYSPRNPSANALSPEFQGNPLLDRDIVRSGRVGAAEEQIGRRAPLTIGEAASQGVDVPLSQTLRYQLSPDAKFQEFLDNILRDKP